jgi:hypothetical protein
MKNLDYRLNNIVSEHRIGKLYFYIKIYEIIYFYSCNLYYG